MPIVALIAFLISVIIAYMSARQLRGLGADIYVVDLVTIGVLRNWSAADFHYRRRPLRQRVCGRARLHAAQRGGRCADRDRSRPVRTSVVPRVLGLTLALPLLTIIADLIGLTGGALLCRYLLDMPLSQYANRVIEAISPTTFWVGVIRPRCSQCSSPWPVVIAAWQVRGSARELGRLVTVAGCRRSSS